MFGSHSLGLSAGYSESEDSDGKTTSSGNFGANFSVSSSTKKWVSEQTSLTGNSVNIYVENKTTLKGAVIAATSDDLTLDTGSFEYIHIKDKDISYNFGGGANAGANYTGKPDEKNNTWSVNANYGFSQNRQTNFATIGEGTIIVRDGETDLSGLNRDVTKAQYGTVDIGLKGGFTVDSSTVALVTSPIKTITETYAALEKGYEGAKRTSADIYAESIIIYEKAGNLISYGVFGLDGDFEVQNARVRDQLERYGIMLSFDGEAGLYKGRTIRLEGGTLIRVELDNGLWNTSEVTLFLQGDRGNGGIIGALNSAGQAMNEWGAGINEEITNSKVVMELNKKGVYLNEHPEKAIWVCSGAAAVATGVPILIGSMPVVSGLVVTEGVKNAAIMGTINGSVQVGSNMLVNNDYTIKGNTTAFGAGFVTGALLSRVGSSANPILMNLGTGIVSTVGDLGSQSAMNIQAGKSAATDLNYTKAFFVGSMSVFGLNITAPITNGATKLTFPEKTAVGTMFLAPTSVGSDILFNKNK